MRAIICLILIYLGWRPARTHEATAAVSRRFRVGLRDLDPNLHMNNARYLTYLDWARFDHALHTGLYRVFPRNMKFLVANAEISYIRSLLPRQRFDISSRVLCWDERYYYMEHVFTVRGQVYAKAYARLVFMHENRRADPRHVLADVCGISESPAVPEVILRWQEMLAAKRGDAGAESQRKAA